MKGEKYIICTIIIILALAVVQSNIKAEAEKTREMIDIMGYELSYVEPVLDIMPLGEKPELRIPEPKKVEVEIVVVEKATRIKTRKIGGRR